MFDVHICSKNYSYSYQQQPRRMEIWFDLQNVSVVSDLQNISPPGSDVNMKQKCTITLGKRRNWNPGALLVFCIFYPQSFRHGAVKIWSYLWNKKIGHDRDLDNTQLLFCNSSNKACFPTSRSPLKLFQGPLAKCICPNFKMYLSKLQNVFVQFTKCSCPSCNCNWLLIFTQSLIPCWSVTIKAIWGPRSVCSVHACQCPFHSCLLITANKRPPQRNAECASKEILNARAKKYWMHKAASRVTLLELIWSGCQNQ